MSEELMMLTNICIPLGWLILLVSLKKGWNLSWKAAIVVTLLLCCALFITFAVGFGEPKVIE